MIAAVDMSMPVAFRLSFTDCYCQVLILSAAQNQAWKQGAA
jgi:hypothetical protein